MSGSRPLLATLSVVTALFVAGLAVLPQSFAAFTGTTSKDANAWKGGTWVAPCVAGSLTVPATADAYVGLQNPTVNNGTSTSLSIRAQRNRDRRAFVYAALPVIPAGCTVTTASLTLNVTTQKGLTVNVHRAAAAWDELTVTWNNQPATTGTATSVLVNTTGTVSFDVSTQVAAMYAGSNFGFRFADSAEGSNGNDETATDSRETLSGPTLTVSWG